MSVLVRSLAAAVACAAALGAQQFGYPTVYPAARMGGQYMHNYYIPPAPGSTPWAPAWAPDGRSIAVSMQGSIWQVDVATGAAEELTYNRHYHSSPAYSPDGKWLVYTADHNAQSVGLEILNLITRETYALTSDEQVYLDPVFSPDGARLAYVRTSANGAFSIHVRPIREGRWAGEAMELTPDHAYPRERDYTGKWDGHVQPSWTPDGKEIVFLCNRDVSFGSGDIWRMPVEPNGIARGRIIHREQTLDRTRPHVSMDGKRILYSSTAGSSEQTHNLYVVPIGGGPPYKLTFGTWDHFHPRFSPDGEWIAYISNRDGLPQLALLETHGGAKKDIRMTARRWRRPMGKLHVRVTDAGTGAKLAARILGLASDGKFYPPVDAYSRLGRSAQHSFHTQGEFTADVPPGAMTVDAVAGVEYEPASAKVDVAAGKSAEVTLRMKRAADPSSKGWWSGSTHVHMNYGGNLHNTPKNLMDMARAEGLNLVMNLIANKDNRILDYDQYQGAGEHSASRNDPRVKLHFGEEYRPPFWGHMFFIGLKDHLISPFFTAYEGTAVDSLYPSNTDMLRKARAQGALTAYVHAWYGDSDPVDGDMTIARAFPVDAALGLLDCLEWSGSSHSELAVWHHALNNDLRIAPVGGEDSITSLHRTKLIGSVRTYAASGPVLRVDSWIEALRKGKTFFTTGPLLEFRVNGKIAGEEIRLAAGGGTVTIEASVKSIAPVSKVRIHSNGKVIREIPVGDGHTIAFRDTLKVTGSAWFSLSAEGPPYRLLDAEFPQAATNAIRVYTGDKKIRSRASAEYFVRWIEKLQGMAREWEWWRSEKEKEHVTAQFEEAKAVYRRLASEAE
jgi:TolB protein